MAAKKIERHSNQFMVDVKNVGVSGTEVIGDHVAVTNLNFDMTGSLSLGMLLDFNSDKSFYTCNPSHVQLVDASSIHASKMIWI